MAVIARKGCADARIETVGEKKKRAGVVDAALRSVTGDFHGQQLVAVLCFQGSEQNKRTVVFIVEALFCGPNASVFDNADAEGMIGAEEDEVTWGDHHLPSQIGGKLPVHDPRSVAFSIETTAEI
ncbi:MAG: hypothetical protein A4E68_00424 [Syntrophaceae bacterium PtaB.Bin095]|nr:MAG: hypothetical protein A4E68_00424 [Syntrophaceae bacterium PtaB.Bin095]